MRFLFSFTLTLPFNLAFANDCNIQIIGSDMMKYDLQEINISSKCVSFEIKLKHGGNYLFGQWVTILLLLKNPIL